MSTLKIILADSILHIRSTFRTEYPKTERRCSVGNLSEKLHTEFMDFCSDNNLGQAEGLAALLDFALQHEEHYADEIAAIKKQSKRRA